NCLTVNVPAIDGIIGIVINYMQRGIFSSVFFFSSRRRHTRSKRDWSSDVCSSDLGDGFNFDTANFPMGSKNVPVILSDGIYSYRSEERRVGKESRSRWVPGE